MNNKEIQDAYIDVKVRTKDGLIVVGRLMGRRAKDGLVPTNKSQLSEPYLEIKNTNNTYYLPTKEIVEIKIAEPSEKGDQNEIQPEFN